MSKYASDAPSGDTLPMSVANMTFMLNKLGEDCAPLQFLRELTQNSIESILTLDNGDKGEICWDVDWNRYDLMTNIYKLSVIDTGTGMTGEEMVEYINKLSSSIHKQSPDGNFGVGAKIAALPQNPAGLVYLSWKDGIGYMSHLWFDPAIGAYGLKRFPENDGEFWLQISDDIKPKNIGDHGTMVILLGADNEKNTMEPPQDTPMRSRWVLRYLNTRYFKFPEGVRVRAREGWENPRKDTKHNFLRDVKGQGPWLDQHAADRGSVQLTGGKALWWILKEDVDRDSGHNAGSGHVAALYQDELYEFRTGRSGIARLQAFGVIFGCSQVVIYVMPEPARDGVVTANTARTMLSLDGEDLPWIDWATEFREKMPDAIIAFQDKVGAKAQSTDHKAAIRERLKGISDLLRFSRYRPAGDGASKVEPENGVSGGTPRPAGRRRSGSGSSGGGRGGRAGDVYALFAEEHGDSAEAIRGSNLPDIQWVRAEDGTRTPPDLDDRAAKFLLQNNKLLVNGDFRAFTDMVDRWMNFYSHIPGAGPTIESVVREWFEQQLIECVMSALALKGGGNWSMQELAKLWSEEALTAAVLPRYHINQEIKRALGHKLGSLSKQRVAS